MPGFKESNLNELYTAIYAVNREAMDGGYKGQKFLINDAELSKARQELQLELRTRLLEKVNTENLLVSLLLLDQLLLTTKPCRLSLTEKT